MKNGIFNFTNLGQALGRSEMKKLMAGSGGMCLVECCNCSNSTCKGWVDDCQTGIYEICGPGDAWSDPCAQCTGPISCS